MSRKRSKPQSEKREFGSRIVDILGSEAELSNFFDALKELSAQGPRSLRTNSLKNFEPSLLEKSGLRLTSTVPWAQRGHFFEFDSRRDLVANPCVGAGLVYLQEAGAMEAVEMLDPQPGDWVLDLCAAPGGKSTQIGERLAGSGWLVANDPVRKRAQRLEAILSRHGVFNSSVFALEPRALSPRFPAQFDKILVDAPCSGESLFAKRSELRMDVSMADVQGCARRQFAILKEASKMLKVGGTLVYSTCTYSREENEDLLSDFMAQEIDEGMHWRLELERRRWPHLDGVAGGYGARLILAERKVPLACLRELDADTYGLLRHAWVQWNGEVDVYAATMAAPDWQALWSNDSVAHWRFLMNHRELNPPECCDYPATLEDARAYLRGESLATHQVPRGMQRLSWEDWPLGPANATGDRLNNLLPKILRELL